VIAFFSDENASMRLKMPEEKSTLHTFTSAYQHWDLKNRFAKSEPHLHKEAADPLLASR
jgi:hypothetical protein